MSNPRAKAERSKAKDIRQGIKEQRPVNSGNKKKKHTHKLIGDYGVPSGIFYCVDYCFGKYCNIRQAEEAFKSFSKKNYVNNLRIEEI